MRVCTCMHTHSIALITVPGTDKHMRTLANTMSVCCYLTWGTGPVLPHVPKIYLSTKVVSHLRSGAVFSLSYKVIWELGWLLAFEL